MSHRVVLIRGDGIGPEIADAAREVLDATGVAIDWELAEAGAAVAERAGNPLPDAVLERIRDCGVALKGPIGTPVAKGFRSVNVQLRRRLDLYACVRPCRTFPGVPTPFRNIDLVIIRENTEDLYAGIEFQQRTPEMRELLTFLKRHHADFPFDENCGISIKPISVEGTRRIVRFAFDYARRHGRHKVTAVHKANIMKFSDGLFLEVAHDVAKEYLEIEFSHRIVDNMCMQLVTYPQQYDVLVLPNLYGDIISDLAAGMIGGLGLAPGANVGEHGAIFEPTHGSAPDIAGMDKANPLAMILSGAMLLAHLGEARAAFRVQGAVAAVLAEGRTVTADLRRDGDERPAAGTRAMKEAVLAALAEQPA